MPDFLRPLASAIEATPDAKRIVLEGLPLGQAATRTFALPPPMRIPMTGPLPDPFARDLDPRRIPEEGRHATLAGVPIHIWIENETIHYRVLAPDGHSVPVSRTSGLYIQVERDALVAVFRLVAPGEFSSLGCTPVPDTSVPPGHYVPLDGTGSRFTVYENKAAYLLEETVVNAQIDIIRGNDA